MPEQLPDFDPYALLGVDASADEATIDRAYKARIRYVHPDIAGTAGLNETKRLNIAREWLTDPELRAQLPKPPPSWSGFRRRQEAPPPPPPPPRQASEPPRGPASRPPPNAEWDTNRPREARPSWSYDRLEDDPLTFDLGSHHDELHAFFERIRGLSDDDRARVTFSLGDEPPMLFDEFKSIVSEALWAKSLALTDAIDLVWAERAGEAPPLMFPSGRVFGNGAVVADAYAQWILLGGAIRQRTPDSATVAALQERSTWAWDASIGHPRYGTYEREVLALYRDAHGLSVQAAQRLSRSWHKHMGSYVYGRPGEDWFPGSIDQPKPILVSARLAAVDASRIEPPAELPFEHRAGFRFGLRLTAHVLALGSGTQGGRDYLQPWRDTLNQTPSFADRARWGMPLG